MKGIAQFVAGVALAISIGALADAPSNKISPAQVIERIDGKDAELVILDVRTPEEFAAGHLPGARNISHDQLLARIAELDDAKDKDIVVYCRSGRRSELAIKDMKTQGFERLLHLEGDMLEWQAQQRPLAK